MPCAATDPSALKNGRTVVFDRRRSQALLLDRLLQYPGAGQRGVSPLEDGLLRYFSEGGIGGGVIVLVSPRPLI